MKLAALIILAALAGCAFPRESADRMTDGDGAAIAEFIKRGQ
jgi:hypothetical protein